jgi:hypothetical protein
VIGLAEILLFLQNGSPTQPCLVDFEDQPAKQFIIAMYGKAIVIVVVVLVLLLLARF